MRARGTHVWWAIALVLVAGCNQIFGLALPVGGEEVFDARDHDARVIDGPADRDGDGVIDGDDNCPGAENPGQEDEDSDRHGDRCDLCPHLGQADDVDGDEDNIPDACDPYPTLSGGRLRWSGFHSGDELDEWDVAGAGGAEWANGEVRLTPVLDGEVRFLRKEDDTNAHRRTQVIAALTVEAPNAGGVARRALGLVTNLGGIATNDFFLCQIETDLPVTDVRLREYRIEGAVAASIASATIGAVYPAGDVILQLDVGDDVGSDTTVGMSCALSGVVGSHSLTPAAGITDLTPGFSGVRTIGVPARVRWAVIIDHP